MPMLFLNISTKNHSSVFAYNHWFFHYVTCLTRLKSLKTSLDVSSGVTSHCATMWVPLKNFWNQRDSSLGKILIVIIVIVLFVLFMIVLFTRRRTQIEHDEVPCTSDNVSCTTLQCIKATTKLSEFIDPSVDPCDNFYNFVCGNFLNRSIETKEVSSLSTLAEITTNRLNALITEPTTESLPRALLLERSFYQSCMNTSAMEKKSEDTLRPLLEKLDEWQIFKGNFSNKDYDWIKSVVKSKEQGFRFNFFLTIKAEAEINITKSIILTIKPSAKYYMPPWLKETYIDFLMYLMTDLGFQNDSNTRDECIKLYEFRQKIEEFREDEEKYGQQLIIPVKKLYDYSPTIPWITFLNNLTASSIPFTNDTLVLFKATRFLKNVLSLLEKTELKTQAYYIVWKNIARFPSYLRKNVRERYRSLVTALDPKTSLIVDDNNRKLLCLAQTKLFFPSVAETMYTKKYLSLEKRSNVKHMIEKIREQVLAKIKSSWWLSENDKELSLQHMNEIEDVVGASDRVFQEDFDKIVNFEGFNFPSDNIIDMITVLDTREAKVHFKNVNKKFSEVQKQSLKTSPPLTIDAYYAKYSKLLIIPSSITQELFYNSNNPQYMNYGRLGFIIGHELTHGLMALRFKGESQWSRQSTLNFYRKALWLTKAYDNYPVHLQEFAANGVAAFEENVADLAGVNFAYEAYQKWTKENGLEQKLPGFDYTPNQIFWIMYGTFRCYQPRLKQNVTDKTHGVPSFMINNSVKNSPYFAWDFMCPVGSNMNPVIKHQAL